MAAVLRWSGNGRATRQCWPLIRSQTGSAIPPRRRAGEVPHERFGRRAATAPPASARPSPPLADAAGTRRLTVGASVARRLAASRGYRNLRGPGAVRHLCGAARLAAYRRLGDAGLGVCGGDCLGIAPPIGLAGLARSGGGAAAYRAGERAVASSAPGPARSAEHPVGPRRGRVVGGASPA